MKKIMKTIAGICALWLLVSCDEVIKTPQIKAVIDKQELQVNESMTIDFAGTVADNLVVFPGDNMQNYDLREQSNTGLVVNKNRFTYSYLEPGNYKVVCVASTSGDMATNLKFDTCVFIVNVIDDQTEIDRISCPRVIQDEIFAERYPNDEWLVTLPQSLLYNNREQTVSRSQRLRFTIQSDSTKVFVNGAAYSATTAYNLSTPVNILVKSDFGTERPYTLYMINFPRFSAFKLQGVSGVNTLDVFDYSAYTLTVTLPTGTDLSRLVPEFTTYAATDKVYIGNAEQQSTVSEVDFTAGEVVYRIVSTLDGKPDMQAETTVFVKIAFQ